MSPVPCVCQWPESENGYSERRKQYGHDLENMKKAAWLNEALEELDACLIDAVAEDLDKPSEVGLKKAGRILKKICNYSDG